MRLSLYLEALTVLLVCFGLTGVAVVISCGLKEKKEERDEE